MFYRSTGTGKDLDVYSQETGPFRRETGVVKDVPWGKVDVGVRARRCFGRDSVLGSP